MWRVLSRRFWVEGPGSFVLAVGLALVVRWAFFEAYVIPSTSMLPTLLVHDHIFVSKIAYGLRVPFSEKWLLKWSDPDRGEVAVFKLPSDHRQYFIKRIVGLPGDQILYENGNLYVNGEMADKAMPQALREDLLWVRDKDFPGDEAAGGLGLYVHWEEKLSGKNHSILLRKAGPHPQAFGPVVVPAGQYMVLGDNRDNSLDSRAWDERQRFVPRELLVGRAQRVWLSCERTLPFLPFLCDPFAIRWRRLGHSIQ